MPSAQEESASASSKTSTSQWRKRGCRRGLYQDRGVCGYPAHRNPVDKYSADIDGYYEYTRLFTAIAQTLGEGYALHKQDIFVRKPFRDEDGGKREYLSESYFNYFNGREYTDSVTYLTVTQEAQKSRLFSFDGKSGVTFW